MQRQVEGFSKEPVCSEFTCLVLKVNVAKSRHFFIHVEFISEAGGGGRCLICDPVSYYIEHKLYLK